MNTPKVSIITVNYKQKEVTADLLRSILLSGYPNLEVILVDNESDGSDETFYCSHYPGLRYLYSPENVGFAGGNNLGIQASNGEYLFFLNNDTEISSGLIEHLLEGFADHQVGAVSPVIRYAENPTRIQFAGYTAIHPLTGRNSPLRQLPTESWSESPYFHGAAVLISRKVIEQAGVMPEEYFLYYEELDWSEKIRKNGFQILVAREVSIIHKESISTGKNSPLKVYYQTRNRIRFMKENSSLYGLFLSFFLLVSFPKNLLRLPEKHRNAFWLGCKDALVRKQFGWKNPVYFRA
ncbi:glycosyltransferase family 2 protein [Algoriphagus taiwanensis]|uniref:Glycosyltransferase family 2 protein n=1 Tax=Algoriphagus taiwanensis TaxID=1445656 RepID=A0ABQ6Q0Z0_9BACT|nr:glycosyltransferase family 2 protein [Algoriphagus taiwanensis]